MKRTELAAPNVGLEPLVGPELQCYDCETPVVLPYADETRTAVLVAPLHGWTCPPLRCPKCSAPVPLVSLDEMRAVFSTPNAN